MSFQPVGIVDTITIANGATNSTSVLCDGAVPAMVLWPAAMTSTAATAQVSADHGATWHTIQALDGSGDYDIAVAASAAFPLDPAVFAGCSGLLFRLVAGSSEGAARTITLVRRPV